MKSADPDGATCGCVLYMVIFAIYSVISAWSINYLLAFLGMKAIHVTGAWVLGILFGYLSVPAALLIALLRFFGVPL